MKTERCVCCVRPGPGKLTEVEPAAAPLLAARSVAAAVASTTAFMGHEDAVTRKGLLAVLDCVLGPVWAFTGRWRRPRRTR